MSASLRLSQRNNLRPAACLDHGQRNAPQVLGNQQRHVRAHSDAMHQQSPGYNIDLNAFVVCMPNDTGPVTDHRNQHLLCLRAQVEPDTQAANRNGCNSFAVGVRA